MDIDKMCTNRYEHREAAAVDTPRGPVCPACFPPAMVPPPEPMYVPEPEVEPDPQPVKNPVDEPEATTEEPVAE